MGRFSSRQKSVQVSPLTHGAGGGSGGSKSAEKKQKNSKTAKFHCYCCCCKFHSVDENLGAACLRATLYPIRSHSLSTLYPRALKKRSSVW